MNILFYKFCIPFLDQIPTTYYFCYSMENSVLTRSFCWAPFDLRYDPAKGRCLCSWSLDQRKELPRRKSGIANHQPGNPPEGTNRQGNIIALWGPTYYKYGTISNIYEYQKHFYMDTKEVGDCQSSAWQSPRRDQ